MEGSLASRGRKKVLADDRREIFFLTHTYGEVEMFSKLFLSLMACD
jgi:hypothetical protein